MESKDADNEDAQTPHPTEWLQDAQSQVLCAAKLGTSMPFFGTLLLLGCFFMKLW